MQTELHKKQCWYWLWKDEYANELNSLHSQLHTSIVIIWVHVMMIATALYEILCAHLLTTWVHLSIYIIS